MVSCLCSRRRGAYSRLERLHRQWRLQRRGNARGGQARGQGGRKDRQTLRSAKGFVVLPLRWIVERTLGWFGRCRRIAKDFENLTRTQLAFVKLAMIRLMARRNRKALEIIMKLPDELLENPCPSGGTPAGRLP